MGLWLLFGSSFTATTSPEPYDCDAGFSNWALGWSASKKAYCCNTYSKGCPTTAPPLVPIPAPAPMSIPMPAPTTMHVYDCDAGYSNWEKGWSTTKKVFCCLHKKIGCPTAPPQPSPAPQPVPVPVPVPVPIPAPAPIIQAPAPAPVVTTSSCPSGLPPSGLPPAADKGPYDCEAGYHPCYKCLVKHWSSNKLDWCCKEKNKGCKSNTPMSM